MLSAEKGADRVAQKDKRHLPEHGVSEGASPYRCENCQARELIVSRTFAAEATATESLPCHCEEGPEHAAIREVLIRRTRTVSGALGADHRAQLNQEDEPPEDERTEVELQIECERCYKKRAEKQWDVEDDAEGFQDTDDGEDYWEVRCSSCDHEIEFGWSHPERGGRIWPCESIDFNPWKTFPETRFIEVWARRNWLRPST